MKKKLTDPEALIMGIIWSAGEPVTVRYVYERIQGKRKLAYTTIMTVMARLAEKKILDRDKSSRAYLYTALVSRNTMLGISLKSLANQYFGGAIPPLVEHLMGHKVTKRQMADIEKTVEKMREGK